MQKQDGQLYKVRIGTHGEKIIHAPVEAEGWYGLSVLPNGDFTFTKVKKP